jgi:hypothetical protein
MATFTGSGQFKAVASNIIIIKHHQHQRNVNTTSSPTLHRILMAAFTGSGQFKYCMKFIIIIINTPRLLFQSTAFARLLVGSSSSLSWIWLSSEYFHITKNE